MKAGTIARLTEPADEPLESWFHDGGLPALEVEQNQSSLDDRVVQMGTAATRMESTTQRAGVGVNPDGEHVAIHVENEPDMADVVTEWMADVTDTGLLAAESTTGDDQFAFPFDLFANLTERNVERLKFDVAAAHQAWSDDDSLGDVWMTGQEDHDEDEGTESTTIQYHDAANVEEEPSFGMGFIQHWNGTVERGVVYESGFVAIYSSNSASAFIQFVEENLLPFAYSDGDGTQQTTLGGGPR